MIYIFDRDEKLMAVFSNKDNKSCPILSAELTEELNGPVTFEFEIPADHTDSQYLQEDYMVAVKDKEKVWQLFYVRELEDIHGSVWSKRAFCEHSIVELLDSIIVDLFIDSQTAPTALPTILAGTRWQLGTSTTHADTHDLTVKYENVMDTFTKFYARWEIEVKYRVQITGQAITARYIDIYTTRGPDTGKRFEYNKDMTEIIRTIDTSQIKTGLYGLGKENEANVPLKFGAINGGYDYVVDDAARLKWGRPVGGIRKDRWGVYKDNEIETDMTLLKTKTQEALDILKNPLVQYEIKALDITTALNVPHEVVVLGMTIGIIDRDLQLQLKSRVIKQKVDLLNEDYTEVTFGNFLPTQSQNVSDANQLIQEIANTTIRRGDDISTAWLEGTISALQNQILAGTGTVTITETDGILVQDAGQTKAIRLLGGILAIANTKTNGIYNWRTFGTGDGFVADQITSGFMLFDRARGGTLLLGGTNNANGRMVVYNSAGDVIADLDAAKGGFNTLYVGNLQADNMIKANFKPITYIVRPTDGNDQDDGLTTATAFKRLQFCIDKIPKNNNAFITIYMENTLFNENEIHIEGFFGFGQITIDFGGATINGMVYIRNNSQYILLQNGKVNQVYGTQYIGDGTVTIYYTPFAKLLTMEVYSRNNVDYGLKCRGSNVIVESSKFYDQTTSCIQSEYGGNVDMIGNNTGAGRAGLRAIGTGRIAMYGGTMPSGTVLNQELGSGGTIIGTTSGYSAGTPSTLAIPPTTKIYAVTAARSWRSAGFGWRAAPNYDIYQGEWTGFGNHKGCFWFNNTTINTDIAGKTLKAARIKMKRRGSGGYSGKTFITLWTTTSPSTIIGGAEPIAYSNLGQLNSYAWNEELWFDIPFAIITGLAAGTYQGFMLYVSSAADYMIFESSAVLELTWS